MESEQKNEGDVHQIAVKSLAELKRLIVPGRELIAASHMYHPEFIGLVRKVSKTQTTGFYSVIKDQPNHPFSQYNCGKGIYTTFEKAGDYIFDGTTVKVINTRDKNRGILFEFEILSNIEVQNEIKNADSRYKTINCSGFADKIIYDGTRHTENGHWRCFYSELGVSVDDRLKSELLKELQERDEVQECILCEDCVEINFHLEYCPYCKEGGVKGAMSLLSLIGCNLEDVHLVDADEEHELATIVELNDNTLTDEGKREWADVLDSKVNRIYEGEYGVQIELTGAEPERIGAFSQMLAGYCLADDYDRCVNDEDNKQEISMNL